MKRERDPSGKFEKKEIEVYEDTVNVVPNKIYIVFAWIIIIIVLFPWFRILYKSNIITKFDNLIDGSFSNMAVQTPNPEKCTNPENTTNGAAAGSWPNK